MQELKEIKIDEKVVFDKINDYLGEEADYLLNYNSKNNQVLLL